jgi:hypothetical protein
MLLLSARGAVAAATEAIDQPGTYEPVVIGLDPAVYLKFDEIGGTSFGDSSGHGRTGLLMGTGAALGATALAPNVGTTNKAVDLGSGAWIEIPHAAVDVALSFPASQPWTGGRKVADVTVSIHFEPNSLPSGDDRHVIVSKSHTAAPGDAASYTETHSILATAGSTVSGGSFEAYLDADGAVHVECRSFRGRPARIRTPDGAVAAGTTYHLVVQLSYDGVAAWLDGAKFEDGYANLLHVFGLAADIRGIMFQNDYDWMIGRAAWGGQADLIVDEFAIYLAPLDQGDAEALAQVGATAPLEHFIWGQRFVNASGFANINAAISNVNGLGGGTVLVNPGTYNEDITPLSNVRIRINGTGQVTINGWCRTPDTGFTNINDNAGNFGIGAKTLNLTNNIPIGAVVCIMSVLDIDRDFNGGSPIDSSSEEGELFEVIARTNNSLTFEGAGSSFDFSIANRDSIRWFVPHDYVAIEGNFRFTVISTGGLNGVLGPRWCKNLRVVGATSANLPVDDDDNGESRCITPLNNIYCTIRDHTCDAPHSWALENGGMTWNGCTDCVASGCFTFDGKHGADFNWGGPNGPPAIRCEHHDLGWDATNSAGEQGTFSASRAHVSNADCIIWNFVTNRGGPEFGGIKQDHRWYLCGRADIAWGALISGEGSIGSYVRDVHVLRPVRWFHNPGSGSAGVNQCRFENITRSANPTTSDVHTGQAYGTGANVNTYCDVDGPSEAWTEAC